MTKPRQATTVLRFVVLIGVVNLFADLTYEGARSVTGPFLAQLGATSTAFGIFDTGFGVAWLAGSIAFGLLYDRSLHALVTVSVVAQLLSLPLFVLGHRAGRHSRG